MFISVPVTHFNDEGGWKKQFDFPKITYVVSIVELSNAKPGYHEVCFLGVESTPAERFLITEKAYTTFRQLWLDHGSRLVPVYVVHPEGAYDSPGDSDVMPVQHAKRHRASVRGVFLFLCVCFKLYSIMSTRCCLV
jgi:hypothetical protein